MASRTGPVLSRKALARGVMRLPSESVPDADAFFPLQASVRRTRRESSKRSSASVGADARIRGKAVAAPRAGLRVLRRQRDRATRPGREDKSDRAGIATGRSRSRWSDVRCE
jgi:hypothetical protein